MKRFPCNLCGSEKQSRVFAVSVDDRTLRYFFYARNVPSPQNMTGDFEVVKCKDCGLLRVDPRFEEEELKMVYSSDEVAGGGWLGLREVLQEDAPLNKAREDQLSTQCIVQSFTHKAKLVEEACNAADKSLRVLDIGCGKGFFLKAMLDRGHEVAGIDLNPDRVTFARDTLDLQNVYHSSFTDFAHNLPSTQFDAVTLWDVIEHVGKPLDLVRRVKPLLRPGGRLLIYTMTLDSLTYKIFGKKWYYIFPAQHLYYFSNGTMQQLYERAGYEYLRCYLDKTAKLHQIPKALLWGVAAHTLFSFYRSESPLVQSLLRQITSLLNWPARETGLERMEHLTPYYFPLRFRDSATFVGQKPA